MGRNDRPSQQNAAGVVMIPQKIATGCRTRYFRHAKELRYALKQFVSRIQVAANFSGGIRK